MKQTVRVEPLIPLWLAVVLAAAGGWILDLSFPDVGIWPLAFVGIALGVVTLIGRTVASGLLVGFVFGASFYLLHVIWARRYLGDVPWLALAGLEAILWAVASILIVLAYRWMPRFIHRPVRRALATGFLVAGLWTARELFLGSWPYTGFPWGRIGMSQSESPLAHVVSWVGVTGLTFLMVAFVALAIEWARARTWRLGARSVVTMTATPAVLAVVLLATPIFATTPHGSLTVGSVQGNGQAGYFDDRTVPVFQSQYDATIPLLGKKMDVLLWPEGGVDWDPLRDEWTAKQLSDLSSLVDAPIIMNAVTEREGLLYNTSMLWTAEDGAVAMYDKHFPVPFGEYVPDRWFYEAIAPDLIGLIQREYTHGTNTPAVTVDGVAIGLAICFDVIYDQVIWESVDAGAEVFMFQTNNADFRDTDENLQQLAVARMRAIETGRSVVNLSTVGTSQVIAPNGQTLDELTEAEPGAMLSEVELRTGITPARWVAPASQIALLWGPLAIMVVTAGIVVARRSRDGQSEDPEAHDDEV